MLIHWIWLSQLRKITAGQKCSLLQLFRDPEELYIAHREALMQVEGITQEALEALEDKDLTESRKILDDCAQKNISILTYGDGAYPKALKNIEQPPLVLYYKGCLPDWQSMPVIGVVGTRKASGYGLQAAEDLGFEIASCGALVVSGGADGIDTRALQGAMQAGKKVVAVLGFGADVVYPAKNRQLFEEIEQNGCLLTEYIPGTAPYSWNFPRRNRLISGLSKGILVVEAPASSGALNTARHAMDQGRDVFVVPGNINVPSCAGSNELLRERAIPVSCGWDVVREYESLFPHCVRRFSAPSSGRAQVAQQPEIPSANAKQAKKFVDKPEKSGYYDLHTELTPEEQTVISHLTDQPQSVDAVIASTDMPAGRLLSVLTQLAVKGIVQHHPGNRVSRK